MRKTAMALAVIILPVASIRAGGIHEAIGAGAGDRAREVVRLFSEHGDDTEAVPRFRPPHASPHRFELGSEALRIPFKLIRNNVVLPVRVNNSRVLDIALDTGMPKRSILLLDPALGDELGLEFVRQEQASGVGSGDSPDINVAADAVISLPGIEFTGQQVEVLADTLGKSFPDDGVIGLTIFSACVVEIDYDDLVVNLYDPSTFEPGVTWEEFDLKFNDIYLPFLDIQVCIDGIEDLSLALTIDTGSGHSLHLFNNADKHIEPPRTAVDKIIGYGLNGEVSGKLGRVHRLRLGSFVLENILTAFHAPNRRLAWRGGESSPGLIGNNLLRRFNVIFDYSRGKMYLRPNTSYDEPFEYNMAGLALRRRGRAFREVFDVMENSPGARAGIRRGDVIIAINGRNIRGYGDADLDRLFTREGDSITLTIKRGKARFERTVTLERVI